MPSKFKNELKNLLNSHSIENGSNTPDWILANHLMRCLKAFEYSINEREEWHSRKTKIVDESIKLWPTT